MKYVFLRIILILLVTSALCEQNSFLKRNVTVNAERSENVEQKQYLGYCFMKIRNNFFDINSFNSIKPWKILDHHGKPIYFNFCSNIDTSCTPNHALMAEPHTCRRFAGKSIEEKTWTLSQDKKGNDVLKIQFPPGDSCGPGEFYETSLELTCDRKVNVPVITNNRSFNQKHCKNVIKMRSKHACTKGRFTAWWNQFGVSKQALAAILIVIGLYFLFFGVCCWRTNSILINCAILGLIIYSFMSLFYHVELIHCMIAGVVVAFIALCFESLNAFILGIVVGYLTGSLLYNLLIKIMCVDPQVLYWSLLISCMSIISIAGGFMKAYMVCFATSLVGAYALVRGISVYVGGYPDETYVMILLNKKEYTQFGRVFGPKIYLYIGGIFGIAFFGFIIQSCMVPENKPEPEKKPVEENKENNLKAESKNNEKENQVTIGQQNTAAGNAGEHTNPDPNANQH